MNQSDYENLCELRDNLLAAFEEFDTALRQANRRTYEQWAAGGKAVSDEFVSMYPTASEAVDRCEPDEEEEEEEYEEEEEAAQ